MSEDETRRAETPWILETATRETPERDATEGANVEAKEAVMEISFMVGCMMIVLSKLSFL